MESAAYRKGPPRDGLPPERPAAGYWLIARSKDDRPHALLVEPPDGEPLLPVFSDHPEAEMFVWLGGLGGGREPWHPRRATSGELLAMLIGPRGPRTTVDWVSLDPPPEILISPGGAGEITLFRLSRKDFVERLLAERRHIRDGRRGRPHP